MRIAFVVASILLGSIAQACGALPASAQETDDTTRDQVNLVFVAGYQGPLSGRMGPRARDAVSRFQANIGTVRTGFLSGYDRDELERQAEAEKRRLGWSMRLDAPTGMRIGIPGNYLAGVTSKGSGTVYKGTGNAFILQTAVEEVVSPTALRDGLSGVLTTLRAEGYAVTYSTFKDDWFVVNASKTSTGVDAYVRYHLVGRWLKGYILFTPQVGSPIGAMVPAVSLSLQADAEEPRNRPSAPRVASVEPAIPPPQSVAPAVAQPAARSETPPTTKSGSGSGFVVAPGRLLTNHHVIEGCGSVSVAGGGAAVVVATDQRNDLALLAAPSVTARPISFAPEAARLGEDVVAMGYPLGDTLGNRLNITQGIVSSTEGYQGDWTNLQIAVPVQPGNSGGPLLDLEGRIRGVVVTKLKPRVLASGQVIIPEQVNFAIKSEIASGFLKGNGVPPVEQASIGKDGRKSVADVAEASRGSVVQVLCR